MTIIEEAQRILDHPDELVSGKEYRRIISEQQVLINKLRSAGQHTLNCTDEKFMHKKVRDLLEDAVRAATIPVPEGHIRLDYINGWLEPTQYETEQYLANMELIRLYDSQTPSKS